MARPVDAAAGLARVLRAVARRLRQLALVTVAAVAAIVLSLREDGFSAVDGLVTAVVLAPPALLFFFAQGLAELASLPERVRRLPGEGQERAAELARLGRELRGAQLRRLPLVLWRLRGALGSARDVAGIALPLRVLTPALLGLTSFAAVACVVVILVGLVALARLA